MKLMKLIRSSIFQGLSLLFLLGYLLGVLNLHFSDKNNYCFMTYMFEYPQFVVSNLKCDLIKRYLIMFTNFIFSICLCQKTKFIHNMPYLHIVKADSQREQEKCGMFFHSYQQEIVKQMAWYQCFIKNACIFKLNILWLC